MLDARRGGARRDDGHLRGGNVGQEGTHQLPEEVDHTEGAGGVHARAAAAVVEGHRDGGLLDVRPTLEQLAEADVHLGLGLG